MSSRGALVAPFVEAHRHVGVPSAAFRPGHALYDHEIPMLPVSHKELDKAFRRHKTSGFGDVANDSKLLLLVYAAECGLKWVLLERRGHKSTARLEADDLTHDLNALLRKLGEPPKFPTIQIGRLDQRPEQVSVERLHEALRDGVRLIDREKIAKVVGEVLAWIEEDPQ